MKKWDHLQLYPVIQYEMGISVPFQIRYWGSEEEGGELFYRYDNKAVFFAGMDFEEILYPFTEEELAEAILSDPKVRLHTVVH